MSLEEKYHTDSKQFSANNSGMPPKRPLMTQRVQSASRLPPASDASKLRNQRLRSARVGSGANLPRIPQDTLHKQFSSREMFFDKEDSPFRAPNDEEVFVTREREKISQ